MKKILFYVVVIISLTIISGCAAKEQTVMQPEPAPTIEPKEKVAVFYVPFYSLQKGRVMPINSDDNISALIVAEATQALEHKGYEAFFVGQKPTEMSQREIDMVANIDFMGLLSRPLPREPVFNPQSQGSPCFRDTSKILVPVVVVEQIEDLSELIESPLNINITYYAFLINAKTGRVIWYNKERQKGTYEDIMLKLKGPGLFKSIIWDLLKSIKEA